MAPEKSRTQKEIWLVYPLKHTGKRRIPYNDAVEEALCFGWIDSIIKKVDAGHVAQRFTPRRSAKSDLSETNKERVRRLIRAGLMTPAGLAKIQTRMDEPFVIPADILRLLKKDATTWKNFQAFPEWYRRIRIGWIEATRQQGTIPPGLYLKVANLVAIQFGVLVGIMSWLAYSRFESAEPRIAAVEMRKRPVDSVAAVAPISDLGNQLPRALDYGADREQDQPIGEQPAPAAQQYSAEAVQQYTALAAQQYYQQIAPRRYASSRVENRSVAADSLSYAEVNREPAVVPADYVESSQPIEYTQPAQIVYYQPVQYVVFSHPLRFAKRCRPTPLSRARPAAYPPPPDRPRRAPGGGAAAPPPTPPPLLPAPPPNSKLVIKKKKVFSDSRFANRCRPTPQPGVVTPVTHSGSGRRGPPRKSVKAPPPKNQSIPFPPPPGAIQGVGGGGGARAFIRPAPRGHPPPRILVARQLTEMGRTLGPPRPPPPRRGGRGGATPPSSIFQRRCLI